MAWMNAPYLDDNATESTIWFRPEDILLVLDDKVLPAGYYSVYFAGITDEAFLMPKKVIDPFLTATPNLPPTLES